MSKTNNNTISAKRQVKTVPTEQQGHFGCI